MRSWKSVVLTLACVAAAVAPGPAQPAAASVGPRTLYVAPDGRGAPARRARSTPHRQRSDH